MLTAYFLVTKARGTLKWNTITFLSRWQHKKWKFYVVSDSILVFVGVRKDEDATVIVNKEK